MLIYIVYVCVCVCAQCRALLNKTVDVVLYVDRLDGYRVDNLDKQVMRVLARSFGPQFWRIAILVLTHAQLSPPDGVEYAEFVEKRSEALQTAIRQEAGLKKGEKEVRREHVCKFANWATLCSAHSILVGFLLCSIYVSWGPKGF